MSRPSEYMCIPMTEEHNSRFENTVLQACVLAMQSTVRECGKFSISKQKYFLLPLNAKAWTYSQNQLHGEFMQ